MSTPYKTCPDCGNHLDPGETCDCKASREPIQEASQQSQGNPHGPALDAEAVNATKRAAGAGTNGTSAKRR